MPYLAEYGPDTGCCDARYMTEIGADGELAVCLKTTDLRNVDVRVTENAGEVAK